MYKKILVLLIFVTTLVANPYLSSPFGLEKVVSKLSSKLLSSCKVNPSSLEDIVITTFVNLDNFEKTSKLGRIISENMLNELFVRNFDVIDFRGTNKLSIDKKGTYFISRDTKRLKTNIQNKYILVGTYSIVDKYILINSRIIDNQSGKIVASARVHYITNNCVLTSSCPSHPITNLAIVSKKSRISTPKKI